MSVLEQLSAGRGMLSSALGKALARQVLDEDHADILSDCIALTAYGLPAPAQRNVRAGAAKVVEIVAEERPTLVAPRVAELLPALAAPEPQTRWMVLRTMGFCARLNRAAALAALVSAAACVDHKQGLCLASSADLYLGDVGALSPGDAARVFPILRRSMPALVPNEQDWLLESLLKMYANLDEEDRRAARELAARWQGSPRQATRRRAQRLLSAG